MSLDGVYLTSENDPLLQAVHAQRDPFAPSCLGQHQNSMWERAAGSGAPHGHIGASTCSYTLITRSAGTCLVDLST